MGSSDTIGPEDIPVGRVREIMKQSRESGEEVAISFCAPTDAENGSRTRVEAPNPSCELVGVVHTHPGGKAELSQTDRDALSHFDMVCAVQPESGEMACLTGESDGEIKETIELNQEESRAVLNLLPQGSECRGFKSVPSRSDYHDSEEVERCAEFDVGDSESEKSESSERDESPDESQEVPGWTEVEPQGDEIARWEADYPHPLSDASIQYLTIDPVTEEIGSVPGHKREETFYQVLHYVGEVNDDSRSRVSTEEAEDEAREEAVRFQNQNPPGSVDFDIPESINGWERTEFGMNAGPTGEEPAVYWERWSPPNFRNPDRRKEQVSIFKRDGKWHVRAWWADADGETLQGGDHTIRTLPKRGRSFSPTGGRGGRRSSFGNLGQALSPVVEYMEENESEQEDWETIPRFDIRTKNRNFKPLFALIKRVAMRDPNSGSKLTELSLGETNMMLRGTDEDNVGMFDILASQFSFESDQFNREAVEQWESGGASVDGYRLADAITDANMSEEVQIRTSEPREPNEPVRLLTRVGATDDSIPLWPNTGRETPDLPDLDYPASFTIQDASDLQDDVQEAEDILCVSAGENRVALFWGEDRNERSILASKNRDVSPTEGDTVDSCYTRDKIRPYTLSIPRPSGKQIEVVMGQDFPIQFENSVGPNNMRYLVAPRIPEDGRTDLAQDAPEDESPECEKYQGTIY